MDQKGSPMTPEAEEKLLTSLGSIESSMVAIHEIAARHDRSLDEITSTLNGNGKPGLKQVVAEHSSTLANFRRVGWALGAPILAAVGTGLVAAAIYLVKVLS
jgi:hypothetical protein